MRIELRKSTGAEIVLEWPINTIQWAQRLEWNSNRADISSDHVSSCINVSFCQRHLKIYNLISFGLSWWELWIHLLVTSYLNSYLPVSVMSEIYRTINLKVFTSPAIDMVTKVLLSSAGDHFDQMAWLLGKVTPYKCEHNLSHFHE